MIRMTDIKEHLLKNGPKLQNYQKKPEEDNDQASLISSVKKEDLTLIEGIGFKIAKELQEIGITTLRSLSSASPRQVAKARGVSTATAEKFIERAKLIETTRRLDNFSEKPLDSEVAQEYTEKPGLIEANEWENVDDKNENHENPLDYEEIEEESVEYEESEEPLVVEMSSHSLDDPVVPLSHLASSLTATSRSARAPTTT